MTRNEPHVRPNAAGGWDVVTPGSGRITSRHQTQQEAIARARQIVDSPGGGDVVIDGPDGQLRESETGPLGSH